MIQKALEFAVNAHRGQFRDEACLLPYVGHPIEVAALLVRIGEVADEELIAAALLHDTVEESGISIGEIASQFGDRVAENVRQMTREEPSDMVAFGLSKSELYEVRNRLLLEGVMRMEPGAMQIKLADRLSNLIEAKRTRKGAKRNRYLAQSAAILDAIPKKTNSSLWSALERELRGG